MRLLTTFKHRLAAALALAIAATGAQAQTNQELEQRRLEYNEKMRREIERSGAPPGLGTDGPASTPNTSPSPSYDAAANAALAAAVEKKRRNYEKQPPLRADRNPLLGSWTLVTRKKPANELEALAGALGNNCALLWGTGVYEFRPKQLVNNDNRPAMVIDTEYRGSANSVAVLPKEFFRLLVFDFVGPDRVRETISASQLATCEFVRVGTAAQAVGRGATVPGKPGSAPAPALAAATPSAPPDAAARGCPSNLLDQVGRARLPDAQRAVLARFPNVQTRTLGNGNTQLLANGSRCDDARLRATLYEFNGAGVLHQVSLVWNRPDGAVPSPLFNERAALLARQFNAPEPQSPGSLKHSLTDRRIVLEEVAQQGVVVESYGAAK